MYRRPRGFGDLIPGSTTMTPAQRAAANLRLANFWADVKDVFDPSLPTSEVGANIYQRWTYGNLPTPTAGTVPGGAAPGMPVSYDPSTGTVTDNTTGATIQVTDPTERAAALTDLINSSIASGAYTPDAPPLATDLSTIPVWAWALGLGVVGLLVVSMVGKH